METKVSNDVFRNFMLTSMITDISENVDVDENFLIYSYIEKIKKIYSSDNDLFYSIYNGLISVIYLDTYKVLNAKLRDSSITKEELYVFNMIDLTFGIEELQEKIDDNFWLLEDLIKYSLEFMRMNDLAKIATLKKLSESQKYMLRNNFELFENDIDQFDFEDSIPLEVLTNYYHKEIDKEKRLEGINDIGQRVSNVIQEIIGFIRMLVGNDKDEFDCLMQKIIFLDYKWNKYIIEHKYTYNSIDMFNIQVRKDKFEDNPVDALIEESLLDSEYFEELIDSLILIKCDNIYVDEKLINQEMVDDYYKKTLNKKIK